MRGIANKLSRTLGRIILSALFAPFAILVVVRSQIPPGLERNHTGLDPALGWGGLFLEWVRMLAAPGEAFTWSGQRLSTILAKVGTSFALVSAVLAFSALCAAVWVWRARRDEWEDRWFDGFSSGLMMAPVLLWAAGVTLLFNLFIWRLSDYWPDLDTSAWLFPLSQKEGAKWVAAVVVLSFGGGTVLDLKNGLRADVRRLLQQDFVLAARANGVSVSRRIVRNVASPFLARVVGKCPLVFGEVIVAEFVFDLDGVGRELLALAENLDAPALMTATLGFVLLSTMLRGGVDLLAGWLHPVAEGME